MENKIGDKTEPSLTPYCIEKGSDNSCLHLTAKSNFQTALLDTMTERLCAI